MTSSTLSQQTPESQPAESKDQSTRESQPAESKESNVRKPASGAPPLLHPIPPRPRPQPISPPSEQQQYRAIGLVRGRYIPLPEQFTQGQLIASDGTVIDAVLLGRIMSLLKKHMNLEEEHLWVVYPRTRDKEQDLHTQIVGVWAPEKLTKKGKQIEPSLIADTAHFEDSYFSIRGEVVFYSQEKEEVVVKLRQAPRKKDDRPRSFKLKLKGLISGNVLGHFWEFDVQRQASDLVIQSGTAIAALPSKFKKKTNFSKNKGKGPGGFKKTKGYPRSPGTSDEEGSTAFRSIKKPSYKP